MSSLHLTFSEEFILPTLLILIISFVSFWFHNRKKSTNAIITFQHDSSSLDHPIPTKIVSGTLSCSQVLNELLSLNPTVLGLDAEWVQKNKISLLQIAHPQLIILIRMHLLKTIPSELIGIMSNNKILKCGVGIYNDAAKLRHDYNIDTYGCIDINDIFPSTEEHTQILSESVYNGLKTSIGLNTFSKLLLGHCMKYKDKAITISNWEINALSLKQCHYAADDALIGYLLFDKVMKVSKIEQNHEQYLTFCYGKIDIHHFDQKEESAMYRKKKKKKNIHNNHNNHRKKVVGNQGKSKAFFDNCKILKPNGDILSCCSLKGMRWYLKKGLAQKIDEKTIKLTFEPKIRNLSFDTYHQSVKTSQCFVCGKSKNLCKYAVVPENYRQFIDDKYNNKAWRIHDHIPLCVVCHKKARKAEDITRDKFCQKYDVPHYRVKKKNEEVIKFIAAKKAADVLSNKKYSIPIKRKVVLLKDVCHYYGLEYEERNSNDEDVDECGEYDQLIKVKNEGMSTINVLESCVAKLHQMETENLDKKQWVLHSQKLVEVFEGRHLEFIELWRQTFVETMKPKFLPEIWEIAPTNVS